VNTSNNFTQFCLDSSPSSAAFFEEAELIQSTGTGGLSSFIIYSNENEDLTNNRINHYMNTLIVLGKRKEFVFHSKLEFIDYSLSNYSFYLVNILSKSSYEFCFKREIVSISTLHEACHCSLLVIAFKGGVIETFRLHKYKSKIFLDEVKHDKNLLKSIFGGSKSESTSFTFNSELPYQSSSNLVKKKSYLKPLDTDQSQVNPSNYVSLENNTDMTDFILSLAYSSDDYLLHQSEKVVFPYVRFFQENWKDVTIHFNQANLELQKKSLSKKGASYYLLEKVDSNTNAIPNEILMIETNKAWSLLIIVDVCNNLYYLDLRTLNLIKRVDLLSILNLHNRSHHINSPQNVDIFSPYNNNSNNSMNSSHNFSNNFSQTSQKNSDFYIRSNVNTRIGAMRNMPQLNIIKILIDEISGDVMILCSFHILFLNINGVVNSVLDIYAEHFGRISNITCGLVRSVYVSQGEIHLFTGHNDGKIFMWRLISNPRLSQQKKSDNYYLGLNSSYYEDSINDPNYTVLWPYSFDIPFEFRSSNSCKVELLKMSNDCSFLISIHEDKILQYWSYSPLFVKNKKN